MARGKREARLAAHVSNAASLAMLQRYLNCCHWSPHNVCFNSLPFLSHAFLGKYVPGHIFLDLEAMTAPTVVALIAIIPLLPVFGLWLIKLTVRGLGWSLESNGKDRRAAIIARITRDRIAIAKEQDSALGAEDDWQKVEKTGIGTTENSPPVKDDWNGIVGFFHPFW